jgi:hypothetical protein
VKAGLPDKQTAIVKVAQGGSNLVEHWGRGLPADPEMQKKSQLYHALMGTLDSATYGDSTGNPLAYPNEITRLDGALARLDAEERAWEIGCFVWAQGENEAFWSAANQYEGALAAFVAALREDLGRPDMPFVLARLSNQVSASNGGGAPDAGVAAVRSAQEAVALNVPSVAWVDTDDLPGAGDHLHFTSEGYRQLGARLATSCLDLMDEPSSGSGGGGSGGSGAGAGGATGAGGDGAGAAGAGSSDDGPDDDGATDDGDAGDDGCTFVAGSRGWPGGAGLGLALLAGIVLARRRTSRDV